MYEDAFPCLPSQRRWWYVSFLSQPLKHWSSFGWELFCVCLVFVLRARWTLMEVLLGVLESGTGGMLGHWASVLHFATD